MSLKSHKRGGIRRLVDALSHQRAAVMHGWQHDPAIRQVSVAVVLIVLGSAFLPVTNVEHVLLAVTSVQVLIMEVVNSAIEATVDRISEERHPLAKHAKDLASLAVGLSVVLAGVCWLVIGGPVLFAALRAGA